jgi:hypothetical protein
MSTATYKYTVKVMRADQGAGRSPRVVANVTYLAVNIAKKLAVAIAAIHFAGRRFP